MTEFQEKLKLKMHQYVKLVYKVTQNFPRHEIYGVTSQIRRAVLSVILNYIEGYARFKNGTKLQFYEISYGSLKETRYLVYFSYSEKYLSKDQYEQLQSISEEISKMLWSEISLVESKKS